MISPKDVSLKFNTPFEHLIRTKETIIHPILLSIGLVVGLFILLKSADYFIDKSLDIFSSLRMPPFIIGAVVIGFGTSLPELSVGVSSALSGDSLLALSSVIGSNIANIALVLGVSIALSSKIKDLSDFKEEAGFLVAISLILYFFVSDTTLSRAEGVILLGLFIVFLCHQLFFNHNSEKYQNHSYQQSHEGEKGQSHKPVTWKDGVLLLAFLGFLLLSAEVIVICATELAAAFNISDSLIGLTVIALGSSMPELASSLAAVKKGRIKLVLGNVVGSNAMNTLLVLGIATTISPLSHIEQGLKNIHVPTVLGLSVLVLVGIMFDDWKKPASTKIVGGCMVIAYGVYLILLKVYPVI
ncbi:MAG: calcium/sodium antiporter [Proteobacteria bacterium]|nr:calcium/sodium antiporter [Pseudomonadota bacterium]